MTQADQLDLKRFHFLCAAADNHDGDESYALTIVEHSMSDKPAHELDSTTMRAGIDMAMDIMANQPELITKLRKEHEDGPVPY